MMEARRSLLLKKKSKNLIGKITSYLSGWTSANGETTGNPNGMQVHSINVSPNTAYTFSWNGEMPYSMSACEYNESGTFIIRTHVPGSNPPTAQTFTTQNNTAYVILQYYSSGPTGSLEMLKSFKPMLELGTKHTDYEP